MYRLIILVLALSSGFVYGLDPGRTLTQYVHRIWQTQQGLPQPNISSIWQSPEGYLWLGTQGGVVRFDGVRFTPIENFYPNAPANIWVRDLLEDAQHALWIGTNDAGIIRLAGGGVERFSRTDGIPSDTIQCLISGRNGEVWACTPDGLVKFLDGKFNVYNSAQ